jgi:hypothetical protein
MAEELTMGRQLELPFMVELKLKERQINTFNEEDLIAMFEGADLAWMDLLFIDSWFELHDPKSDLVTEVMIFRDRSTKLHYRAERNQNDQFKISNDINRYDIDGSLGDEDIFETMVELPLVQLEDKVWVYL